MLFSLEGLRAMITGGAGAIGKKTAIEMAKQGSEIVIADVRQDALETAKKEIKEATGKDIEIINCDLLDVDNTRALFSKAEEQAGQIDILVNNAGIDRDKLLMKMTEDDLEIVLNVNLRAAFTLTKSAVMAMSKRKFGRIIGISSVVGFTGNPGQVNYCASKAALVGLSKAVALEYAKRGITVNCIAPGAIKTPMIDAVSDEAREKFLAKIPLGYMADPVEIAYAVCFLASREASYITGQTLHVNGGMYMG
ncbi:MAG: 3-oxoacyl-ACP reductase FabG [Alphaproteobacteria bacterium]|nr:3-oxoacyl-ACP reductase FabG [Alphaproteobacteria bacterium]